MNTESEVSEESSLIQRELDTLIKEYDTDSSKAASSTEDDLAILNNTYLKNLQDLETKIKIDMYKTYPDDKKSEYDLDYSPILYKIKKERKRIDETNLIKMNLIKMNDDLKRLDKDYNKTLDNNINQNFKNMVLYGIIMLVCIVLIILISIDSPVSYGILGIIISGSLFMLYINYVKYSDNKFYKSQLDKRKKATGKGESDGKDDSKIMQCLNLIKSNLKPLDNLDSLKTRSYNNFINITKKYIVNKHIGWSAYVQSIESLFNKFEENEILNWINTCIIPNNN